MNNPTAILTADWHIREDVPVCWGKEDFLSTQNNRLQKINDFGIPILHAGDVFNKAKSSNACLYTLLNNFQEQSILPIPGNHDLPNHSISNLDQSSFGVMKKTQIFIGHINVPGWPLTYVEKNKSIQTFIFGIPYGEDIKEFYQKIKKSIPDIEKYYELDFNDCKKVLLLHYMTYKNVLPFPGCTSNSAIKLLKQYPLFDLIVTGDNHKPFTEELDGRILVNPGSIIRQSAIENHKPRIYLWDALSNKIKIYYLSNEPDPINTEYLDKEKNKEKRINVFINRLDETEVGLSFEKNLKEFFAVNKINKDVENKIWEVIEKEK